MDLASQSAQQNRRSATHNRCFKTSIIIVNYNAGERLLHCLSGVVRSAVNSEILVVDNASTDQVADLIEVKFPQVTLIRSETNLGFGAGCNLAASRARSEYLIFLNPDTTVEDGWLEGLIRPLRQDAKAGMVTAKILLASDPNRINTCGNTIHITGIAMCRGFGLSPDDFNHPQEVAAVSGAAFAIRRHLYELLGGFDEEMFLYMEDTDLSCRARLAGWRCLYSPESVVRHDYELKMTPLKVFYQERNRYLMLFKILRWPTLVILLPVQIVAELMAWGFVLLRDRANISNKIRAYGWIVANWRYVIKQRRAAQILREIPDRCLLRSTEFTLDFDQVSGGFVASLARWVLTPVFFVLRTATMAVVWW